jgi:hypothetical protein
MSYNVDNLSYFHTPNVQLLDRGWWFSAGTPASSTNTTGRHDIAEILLKVALNTINQKQIQEEHRNTLIIFL